MVLMLSTSPWRFDSSSQIVWVLDSLLGAAGLGDVVVAVTMAVRLRIDHCFVVLAYLAAPGIMAPRPWSPGRL